MNRISRRKHLSQAIRGRIIGKYESGETHSAISRSLDISKSTVSLWVQRYLNTNDINRMPNTGRPKILTNQQQLEIVDIIENNPFTTATFVAQAYDVSRHTIKRTWKQNGIFHHIPALKQRLTEDQRAYRLAFAEYHINHNTDWDRIIFSDEKTFQSDSDKKLHVYRPRNERYNPKYVQVGRRSGRISCGVWGWMSAGGLGELCQIPGKFNSMKYTEVLEDIMIPSVRIVYPEYNVINFMQDNCSFHTSNHTMEWISQHPEIEILDNWPPNSPDLNPIENIWARMVHDWDFHTPRTVPNLLAYIFEKWEELRGNINLTEQLIGSMNDRLRAVVENDGFWTKY